MITIKNENVVWIDVDDTLVMWPKNPFKPQYLPDVEYAFDKRYVPFINYSETVYLKPNEKNIKLLKSYKERGYFVIVHSANGYIWAKHVITLLLLNSYVNLVMTKPAKYVDDLSADEWMQRVYIKDDE